MSLCRGFAWYGRLNLGTVLYIYRGTSMYRTFYVEGGVSFSSRAPRTSLPRLSLRSLTPQLTLVLFTGWTHDFFKRSDIEDWGGGLCMSSSQNYWFLVVQGVRRRGSCKTNCFPHSLPHSLSQSPLVDSAQRHSLALYNLSRTHFALLSCTSLTLLSHPSAHHGSLWRIDTGFLKKYRHRGQTGIYGLGFWLWPCGVLLSLCGCGSG